MNVGKTLFAVFTYVLIAIIKKQLQLDVSIYTFLQILSVSIFEKIELSCALQHDCPIKIQNEKFNLFGSNSPPLAAVGCTVPEEPSSEAANIRRSRRRTSICVPFQVMTWFAIMPSSVNAH